MTALRTEEGLTLERVGEIFGLTRERVCRITPPGICGSRDNEEHDPGLLYRALGKAVICEEAWSHGKLSTGWMEKQIGYKPSGHELPSKFLLILIYGLNLKTREEQLEWLNEQYYTDRRSYEDIAGKLSDDFIPIKKMTVYNGMRTLGFRGLSRGCYSRDWYMNDD